MFHRLLEWLGWRQPECCRRKEGGDEVYRYFGRNFIFDVDRANEIVRDGREPVELEEESTRMSVECSRICEPHIPHVDPSRPGIIAQIECLADDGEVVKGQVLIDGNHRAARCLQLDRPFFAYLLSEEETSEILLRRPVQTFAKLEPEAPCAESETECGV